MSRLEICLGGLSTVIADLDLVLERFDDDRTEAAINAIVALAEQLSDLIGGLVDAFEEPDAVSDLLDDQARDHASQPLPPYVQSDSDESLDESESQATD